MKTKLKSLGKIISTNNAEAQNNAEENLKRDMKRDIHAPRKRSLVYAHSNVRTSAYKRLLRLFDPITPRSADFSIGSLDRTLFTYVFDRNSIIRLDPGFEN